LVGPFQFGLERDCLGDGHGTCNEKRHECHIIYPPETRKLDYEVELAVVMGRKARRIAEKDVKDYVAGFTVSNELSARDIQLAEHENNPFFRTHYIGKSFDTFLPARPGAGHSR
jgi:2-keto-4-pentenoate hydratase/2-oxohepta-3-ene-1,7-dioic acid hydratase in catechol pathway